MKSPPGQALLQQIYRHAHRAAHTVRQAYGWDDEQIIDAIEIYGMDWLNEVYQFIIEDHKRDLVNLMVLLPLARSAFGKEDGKALADYQKHVAKELEKMTPWLTKRRTSLSDLRKKIKPGTIVVIADASDGANNPIFKDATVRKGS